LDVATSALISEFVLNALDYCNANYAGELKHGRKDLQILRGQKLSLPEKQVAQLSQRDRPTP